MKNLSLEEPNTTTLINSDDQVVNVKFRGLRDLLLIYEKLEDGAEITYTEYDEIKEEEISQMITTKENLGAYIKHSPRKQELSVTSKAEEVQEPTSGGPPKLPPTNVNP